MVQAKRTALKTVIDQMKCMFLDYRLDPQGTSWARILQHWRLKQPRLTVGRSETGIGTTAIRAEIGVPVWDGEWALPQRAIKGRRRPL